MDDAANTVAIRTTLAIFLPARAPREASPGRERWLRRTAGQSVGSVGSPNSVMKIMQNIGTTRRNIPEIAPIAAAASHRPAASARPAPPR